MASRKTHIKRAVLWLELFLVVLTSSSPTIGHKDNCHNELVGLKGSNDSQSGRLVNDLLAAYGPGFTRPVLDADKATDVFYRIQITKLIELSTVDQSISIAANLKMSWRDEFLQWNPAEYGGLERVLIPVNALWQPDITLLGNINNNFEVTKPTAARLSSDGLLEWYTPIFLTSACQVHIKYFPFDTQRCEFRFSSWSFTYEKINLQLPPEEESRQYSYEENGVWDLKDLTTDRELVDYFESGIYSEISYVMVLTRRSEYYTTNVLAPFIFLSLLADLMFLLPPSGKDGKVTLAITAVLAMVVFLQVVAGSMPPTGETPLLANYFLVLIILVCLSTAVMIVVYYVQCNTYEPPRWFKRLVLDFMARAVFMYDETAAGVASKGDDDLKLDEVNGNVAIPEAVQVNTASGDAGREEEEAVQLPASLLEDVRYLRQSVEEQAMGDQVVHKWQHGSRVLDRWLLIISLTIWALSTIILLVRSSNGDDGSGSA